MKKTEGNMISISQLKKYGDWAYYGIIFNWFIAAIASIVYLFLEEKAIVLTIIAGFGAIFCTLTLMAIINILMALKPLKLGKEVKE